MKFLLYFLIFYLSFAFKGYFLYASLPDRCSSFFPLKTTPKLKENVVGQRINSLVEGVKAFTFEAEERNGGKRKPLNPYEYVDIYEDVDIKRLFDFIRVIGYAAYRGGTMGKIVEDLTEDSLPDFSRQLGIKISSPENQILRNAIIDDGVFRKEIDFIIFEKEIDLKPNEKKKVLIVEAKSQLRTRGVSKLYFHMKDNLVSILQHLSTFTGEPFTLENTSLHSMFVFIKLYDRKSEDSHTTTKAHKLGMLLVEIKTEEGTQLEIISNVDEGFKIYDFISNEFGELFNLKRP